MRCGRTRMPLSASMQPGHVKLQRVARRPLNARRNPVTQQFARLVGVRRRAPRHISEYR